MLLDPERGPVGLAAASYEVEIPAPGFAEQNPETWWTALKTCLSRLRQDHPVAFDGIRGIGLSGQMHGLVLTDAAGVPLRNAILWLDQRSQPQLEEIRQTISPEEMRERFCNRVSAGFALPSLLWVRDEEPEILARSAHLLCPKDALRLRLTGEAAADLSDASSTCLLDTPKGQWARDILERFQLPQEILPPVLGAMDLAGTVSPACARETGLPAGIPVVAGSGDHSAQCVGSGVISPGTLIANLGTGGQVSSFSSSPLRDPQLRTNTFRHAVPGGYSVFGATLAAGLSLRWAARQVLDLADYESADREAAAAPPGAEGLLYLPYLSGERAPHMDPRARGAFFGLQLGHGRGHLLRAVLEGVAFSLRDCLDLLNALGLDGETVLASGGGAASPLWLQILADVLGKPVCPSVKTEQACLGACLLAGAGTGLFSLEEGCAAFCAPDSRVYEPNPALRSLYDDLLETSRALYTHTADLMHALSRTP